MSSATKVKVSYEEICCYLTSLGAPAKEIKQCPQQWAALQALAQKHGGDLNRKADVKAAGATSKQAAKEKAAAGRKMRKLSQREMDRIRLAFDHFDADASGKLDIEEFRKAMIDCGMMPLGFEVQELFDEADEDGSKDVDFEEYCRFVQLYKSKQNICEKLVECLMDSISPRAAYLVTPASTDTQQMPQPMKRTPHRAFHTGVDRRPTSQRRCAAAGLPIRCNRTTHSAHPACRASR